MSSRWGGGGETILCSEHTDSCYNMEHSTLPDHNDNNVTITDAEICFCSTDYCNNADHLPPIPTPPTASPTSQPTSQSTSPTSPGPQVQCYKVCVVRVNEPVFQGKGT